MHTDSNNACWRGTGRPRSRPKTNSQRTLPWPLHSPGTHITPHWRMCCLTAMHTLSHYVVYYRQCMRRSTLCILRCYVVPEWGMTRHRTLTRMRTRTEWRVMTILTTERNAAPLCVCVQAVDPWAFLYVAPIFYSYLPSSLSLSFWLPKFALLLRCDAMRLCASVFLCTFASPLRTTQTRRCVSHTYNPT